MNWGARFCRTAGPGKARQPVPEPPDRQAGNAGVSFPQMRSQAVAEPLGAAVRRAHPELVWPAAARLQPGRPQCRGCSCRSRTSRFGKRVQARAVFPARAAAPNSLRRSRRPRHRLRRRNGREDQRGGLAACGSPGGSRPDLRARTRAPAASGASCQEFTHKLGVNQTLAD